MSVKSVHNPWMQCSKTVKDKVQNIGRKRCSCLYIAWATWSLSLGALHPLEVNPVTCWCNFQNLHITFGPDTVPVSSPPDAGEEQHQPHWSPDPSLVCSCYSRGGWCCGCGCRWGQRLSGGHRCWKYRCSRVSEGLCKVLWTPGILFVRDLKWQPII